MATKTWDAASERFTETDAGRIDRLRRLRRIHGVARMMDTAIGIPGTRFRFGADSIMGLVPLVGDAGGALIGLYIVNEARRMGVPNDKLAKMIGNLAVDSVVGSVPLAGDLFDVFFKSHRRNLNIVLDHFGVTADDLRAKR
ncbi:MULTISPECIES: DUF4112 domain-containing protein [Rhizobium/Agrobacterium group]|jgi:hypothetical protein|uniref:DUF4112 domain-containing protein n=1 Tax=Rhizobium/Agrobacterium group TaxID=227290 RepID=UPI000714BA2B|nr:MULTISPECIES: DUF4112 domain-containing protein [Rhizobium/Agrobacterium group]KQQ37303.1 hypothetical protein ASG19_13340 [Rhizobium sp. Leaf306]KQQ72248.1 hypothetical protein ASF70_11915 [Rhizobium sp. Leaf321]MBD8663420.1 DUF4112 domain-containing protein [Rhizobium sp. CFBP 8752]NSY18354.1 DUF4112 domain-containing protein [Neorhizobium sp. AL 9.2.2]